jgi:DNA invertase Pin-like site-specific DNA recombinase
MKRVIELIRVSTEGQADDDRASIPAQRAINRRTAAAYGLEIVKSVELVGVSGASILRTPEMQALLKLIESPDIHGVVVREFSRVMRPDSFGDYVLFQVFQETGTILYLPDGPLDLNSKTGKLVAGLRAIIAGNELSEIRERVWAAKGEKRKAGKLASSQMILPFGVGYEEKRGFFYESQAEKVREAFRRFMAGEHSYVKLAEMVGVTPRGMHLIMRNPIWKGWRVIDKKRDLSTAGRRAGADGRQADRPKIKRAPDEVIRVKVIDNPILSEEEFALIQQVMDTKTRLHWRSNPNQGHAFTYNGFLVCAECESLIYGRFAKKHYYVCKSRVARRGSSAKRCDAPSMRRDQLELKLDDVFGVRLTSKDFLETLIKELESKYNRAAIRSRISRLEGEVGKLRKKRERILDSYFEGVLERNERDVRLASLDREMKFTEEMLLNETPRPELTVREMVSAFSPLFDWPFLGRESKRRILAATVPEIHVRDYTISGIKVNAPVSDDGIRTDVVHTASREIDGAAARVDGDESLYLPRLEWLASLTEDQFRAAFRGSPIKRTKWRGLVRNACIALGNSSLPTSSQRERIRALLKRLSASPEPVISESAQWALSRIQ